MTKPAFRIAARPRSAKSALGGLGLLGREPSDAVACEAVGEQGDEVEDSSLGEQIFRDVVEAGGHACTGPIGELVCEPLLHCVQGAVSVCVGHHSSVAAVRNAAPGGQYEVDRTGGRT